MKSERNTTASRRESSRVNTKWFHQSCAVVQEEGKPTKVVLTGGTYNVGANKAKRSRAI